MSKTLRTAGMVVAAVALVAATAGAAAPAVAATATTAATAGGIAGVSAATLTAIGAYGGLAAGVLSAVSAATAPGLSSQGSQTNFTTNPQSGLPYAMGRTRMSGLRFYANTNTRPGYTKFNDLLWFGALLSIGGQIDSIEKFTADSEVVTFAADGNAIGTYHDYQAQKVHLGGSPMASALALSLGGGTAPGWTSAHKLSGITHAMWCLRYNKQGEMYGAGAPEPAWIGKWVKVYDPRLDSTYPGGAGACRALQESTYVWSDNPGLHALTWALGRWQNGERTCGIGAPIANIRVAEFVECANVCEANGWKVGGVEWTTDSKWDTLKRILQAGGARPTQTAAMIGCLVNMPRTAIATIQSYHLHDGLSIPATKTRRERISSVIPRYVDEDSDWSVISGTAITVPEYVTADKGKRTKEIDFPLVQVFSGQEAKQPGQLAAYEIVNSREAGPWTFTTGPEWIGLKTGDVVNLNVPEEGLDNQPVLIQQRGINPATGKVTFTVETETFAKHAFALGETTTPPAPWSPAAPDLKPPAPVETEWSVTGTTSGEGFPALLVAGDSEMPSADAIVIDYRLHAADETPDAGWTNSAILSAVDAVRHVIAPLESQAAYDVRVSYRVGTIDGDTTIFTNIVTGVGKITTIEGQIADQDELLAQLEEDTATALAAAAAAQTDAATATVNAAAALTAANQATDDILAAQDDITANATAISTLSGTVSTQGASITSLQTAVDSNTGSLATLSTTVSTHGGQISTLQTSVTTLQGSVSTLSTTVGTQGASITALQTASSTQAGQLATLTTQVSSGFTNLLNNGDFSNGLTGWTASTSPGWTVVDAWTGRRCTTSAAGAPTLLSPRFPVQVGSSITAGVLSQDNRATAKMYMQLRYEDASGAGVQYKEAVTFTGTLSRKSVTSVVPSGAVYGRLWIASSASDSGYVEVNNFTVVVGTVDIPVSTPTATITQTLSALNTATTQLATLSTTVSTQGSSITANATAITTLQTQTANLTLKVNSGAPNLLPGGSFANGLVGWNVSEANVFFASAAYDPNWGRFVRCAASGGNYYASSPKQSCQPSQTYTLSCDMDSGGGSGGYVAARIVWYNGSTVLGTGAACVKTSGSFSNDEAARVVATAVAPSTADGMVVQILSEGVTGSRYWRRIKLNVGTSSGMFTDESSVTQSFETINTTNTQVASLSTTVSTQGVTITSQQTAITTINNNVTTLFGRAAVTVDVNGRITGWETNNNGQVGDFTIRSDRFRVIPPGGAGSDGFYIDIDSSSRTTQYILSGGIRVVESGWLN